MKESPKREVAQAFGAEVRSRREEAGLTREELAVRAEVSPMYISTIERGLRDPSLEYVEKFARGFGVSPAELLGATLDLSEVALEAAELFDAAPRKLQAGVMKFLGFTGGRQRAGPSAITNAFERRKAPPRFRWVRARERRRASYRAAKGDPLCTPVIEICLDKTRPLHTPWIFRIDEISKPGGSGEGSQGPKTTWPWPRGRSATSTPTRAPTAPRSVALEVCKLGDGL